MCLCDPPNGDKVFLMTKQKQNENLDASPAKSVRFYINNLIEIQTVNEAYYYHEFTYNSEFSMIGFQFNGRDN